MFQTAGDQYLIACRTETAKRSWEGGGYISQKAVPFSWPVFSAVHPHKTRKTGNLTWRLTGGSIQQHTKPDVQTYGWFNTATH